MKWLANIKQRLTAATGWKQKAPQEMLTQLEDGLLEANFGVAFAEKCVADIARTKLDPTTLWEQILSLLRTHITGALDPYIKPLPKPSGTPWVCSLVGVNGSGKTTTAGKLAHYWRTHNLRISLAACDMFRAAAVDQARVLAKRAQVDFVEPTQHTDSAAVAFQALCHAQERGNDILLLDTAGRLHNKKNLMDELQKTHRVLGKQDPSAPHACLLVLDGTVGQNALSQGIHFNEALALTGLILTKIDGTARPGSILETCAQTNVPIVGLGCGEALEDFLEPTAQLLAHRLTAMHQDGAASLA